MTNKQEVAENCLYTFGPQAQIIKAIEEIDECIEELFNIINDNNKEDVLRSVVGLNKCSVQLFKVLKGKPSYKELASEVADVEFMVMIQMKMMMDKETDGKFSQMVDDELKYKIDRTARLVEERQKSK